MMDHSSHSACEFTFLQVQLDSSDEDGVTFYHHLPVEIEPQEFDEKGCASTFT